MKTTFTVELLSFAQKDLKKLMKVQEQIVAALLKLEENPGKRHELSQNLQGIRSLEISVKGSGQFRAAYLLIEEDQVCSVLGIGPHENFYDLLSKRVSRIKPLLEKVREGKREKSKPKKSI